MRYSDKSIDIKKISGPVQLLSTTNMLTYNAPDIAIVQAQRKASSSVSSGTSSRSSTDGHSDASSISNRSTATDASSIASNSPTSSPQTDKKGSYFETTPAAKGASILRKSMSTIEMRDTRRSNTADAPPLPYGVDSPAIPQRHPSHSKKAHSDLAKKRSIQGLPPLNRSTSIASIDSSRISQDREVRRASIDFFNGRANDSTSTPVFQPHPFGKELEQLDEVAEEFSGAINDAECAADRSAMKERGLVRFCADDYINEIEPLFAGFFGHGLSNRLGVPAVAWI
jgi:hypothetical protein